MSTFIKQQVADLVQRGMAEARYGNRAAAAALLRRAVRLDPQHEAAWLWLGGVASDPEEAAFALRAVLQLNPDNQAARSGLRELETSGKLATPAPTRPARRPDSRWRRLRESRSTARSLALALWSIPLVLLLATAGLRVALALQTPALAAPVASAAPRLAAAKSAPTAAPIPTLPAPTPTPPAVATPEGPSAPPDRPEPLPTQTPRATIMAYLVALGETRQALRDATDAYRAAAERRTTAERAAATRTLRDAVQHASEQLAGLDPPSEARDAHRLYLDGLARETEALDDVLAFYTDYDLARSNSAALRMQQARAAMATAAAQWSELAERYDLPLEAGSPR